MANTVIQLKWSEVTSTPPSLNVSEPAYSNVSNKLFIGTADGVIAIGGKYYTDIIDASTNSNLPSTIVKRDVDGSFSANIVTANLQGNATTADAWQTARYIGVSGDATGAIQVNGAADANIPLTLADTTVVAGSYGGSTNAVSVTVDSKGRITDISNVEISSTLSIAGDTGTDAISLITDTLTFVGGDGITTTVDSVNNNVSIDVDNTVYRSTGGTITGDVSITGNLTVTGNTTQIDVQTLNVSDPIIYLAGNNYTSDIVDVGFVGNYFDGSSQRHAGFVRQHGSNTFYAFTGYTPEPDSNVIDVNDASYIRANINANLVGGKISDLSEAISVVDGGTGAGTFDAGKILVGNGTGALQSLANTGTAGTYANASHVPVITTDAYGRVSAVTNTAIAIDTSQVTTGKLAIARGGTNNDTFTTGGITFFDGTKLTSLANTGSAGTYGNTSHVPVITTDAYGRVSNITNTAISIDASAITGTLGVNHGGTGATTFNTNGVVISGATGTSALTAVASSTEGHVLQINSSGVPVFEHLSGGTF